MASRGVIEKRPNVGNFVSASAPTVEMALVLPRFVVKGGALHPVYGQLMAGIQSGIDQRTSSTTILSYRPGHLWEDVGELLVSRRIRGIILAPGSDVQIEHITPFQRAGIEIVLIKPSINLASLGLTTVILDMPGAWAQLMEGALSRGHRDIVVVQHGEYTLHDFDSQIIKSVLARYGIKNPAKVMLDIPSSSGQIDPSVMERVFAGKTLPTAVLVQDEYQASALFRMCYERNVRVPDDLSVGAVFDSTPHLHPVPLTAVDTTRIGREQGRLAVAILMKLLAAEKPIESEIRIRCEIQWRSSMGSLDSTSRAENEP